MMKTPVARRLFPRRVVNSPIGLDIGETVIRVAQLVRANGRWSVRLLSAWRTPQSATSESPDTRRARIARWLSHLDLRGRTVVSGLSPPDLELHSLELPPLPADVGLEQQREAVRWEMQRLIDVEGDGAEIDYWPLPAGRGMRSNAIGVAASRERLDEVLATCAAAGLDCMRVDASPCALARFGVLLRGQTASDGDVWGTFDLGCRLARLIICVGDTPVLARSLDYGGAAWTTKLASSLSVSAETAERHKRDHGVARIARSTATREASRPVCNSLGEMLYNVLRSDIDAIAGEVERSYRYVLQCFAPRRPGPLLLTGGGADMNNLDALLAEKLGVEVFAPAFERRESYALDFSKFSGDVREPLATYACAIGLAAAVD